MAALTGVGAGLCYSFEDYAAFIPERKEESVYSAAGLGWTSYLNVINTLNYLPGQLWVTLHNEVLRLWYWAMGLEGNSPYRPFTSTTPVIQAVKRPPLTKDGAWLRDGEFARQQIVGANPMSIHWAKAHDHLPPATTPAHHRSPAGWESPQGLQLCSDQKRDHREPP